MTLCSLLALIVTFGFHFGGALDVHVSSHLGSNERGDGSRTAPYATIDKAVTSLRQLRADRPQERHFTIVIHEGTYAPLRLDPGLDSGSFSQPVKYTGAPGEAQAVISGGVSIPTSAFTQIGSGPLVRADLFDHGVSSLDLGRMVNGGSVGDCQHEKTDLVFGGDRMTLARWPNIHEGTWNFANIDVGGSSTVGVNLTLQPDTTRLSKWIAEADPWIHGYWTFDWTDSYVRVSNISIASGVAQMALDPAIEIKANARFYGVNLLCEMDLPGEYYINQQNGTLYFYPPVPLHQWKEGMAVITTADVAVNMSHASYLSFSNLTIADSKGVGLLAERVSEISIDTIVVANHGQTGIVIDGQNYKLVNSIVRNTGCVGIQASGGDPLTLTAGSNLISGNVVSRPALWKRTYMSGIRWGGVNNTFSFNEVSDAPHNCFLGGGNEIPAVNCLHEGNLIENCAYEASDTGAWYSCGQHGAWVNRGNVARGNRFKHIRCRIQGRSVEGCGGGVQAVYLDDQMSGWRWENNTFEDCDTALFIGGGRSNLLINNHIVNSSLAVHFDNRGMNWEKGQCCSTCTSANDVKSVLNGSAGKEWAQQWPELLEISSGDHLCVPVYNKIINNTYASTERFIDASDANIHLWLSTSEGNINTTLREPLLEIIV